MCIVLAEDHPKEPTHVSLKAIWTAQYCRLQPSRNKNEHCGYSNTETDQNNEACFGSLLVYRYASDRAAVTGVTLD